MGFDFKPRKKEAGWYRIGAFSWSLMLERGLGLVLGVGKGFKPGEFIYITRPDKLCVEYNDGARVSAAESKELAKVARWIAAIENARINQWGKVPTDDQIRMKADTHYTYDLPWHPDRVEDFMKFADWCEKSGGFTIH